MRVKQSMHIVKTDKFSRPKRIDLKDKTSGSTCSHRCTLLEKTTLGVGDNVDMSARSQTGIVFCKMP